MNKTKNTAMGMAMTAPESEVNAMVLQLNMNKQKQMQLSRDIGAPLSAQRANFLNRGENRKKELTSPQPPNSVPKMMFSVCMA
jgi:putative AlgH/UPF0301 family transcriptional regulator